MSLIRNLFVLALLLTFAGSSFGQVVTRSQKYGETIRRSEVQSVSVERRDSANELISDELERKIGYAMEDEFLMRGVLPTLRSRPAGVIATFYIGMTQEKAGKVKEGPSSAGSLIVECRDADDDRLIWRGVAVAVTSMAGGDPYLWEQKLTEAARMLVRRFNEEAMAD